MMREVGTSNLNEIKSVFNSVDDNLHYYKILKNSFGARFGEVEFAQPVIKHTTGQIIWKTETEGYLIAFEALSQEQKDIAGEKIRDAFSEFAEKTKAFKNLPDDFQTRIMEIPNSHSILVTEGGPELKVVLMDWGFLEDSLERRSGVLSSIFPAPDYSVLCRLLTSGLAPVAGKTVQLQVDDEIVATDKTDGNGLAKLQSVQRGKALKLVSPEGFFQDAEYHSDGRREYEIIIPKTVTLTFRVRTTHFDPVADYPFGLFTPAIGKDSYITDAQGEFVLIHPQEEAEYVAYDAEGNEIARGEVPAEDSIIDITFDPPGEEDEIPDVSETTTTKLRETEEKVTLLFKNFWGRPLKGHSFQLKGGVYSTPQSFTTDKNGMITVSNLREGQEYSVGFQRMGASWDHNFTHQEEIQQHLFSVRALFPWIWWLLIGLLAILLLLCAFGYLCHTCHLNTTTPSERPIATNPCDVQQKSGGTGITETIHELGPDPGIVQIEYDMASVPDKLEVYYQGNLVVSTSQIPGNSNGYVGGSIPAAGCCGILEFSYQPVSKDYQCTVMVTGPDKTNWSYLLKCPETS